MKKTVTDNELELSFQKSYASYKAGRLSQAEKGYKKLIKRKPEWGQPMSALGLLYLDKNLMDKAVYLFEKAVRLNPPDLSACYQLGRLKQLENDHQAAIPLYKKMLEQNPALGLVLNNLGVAYRETGRPDDAMASFSLAVQHAPDLAQAWNNFGVALDEHKKTDKALKAYRKATQLKPDYISPHLNIGIILQNSKQFEQAKSHYQKVLDIDPENKIAQFMLKSISGGDNLPDAAPVEHVRNIFNQCAKDFEAILVEELEYKTPELIFEMVRPHLGKNLQILDLGCGTGLGAQLYKPFSQNLFGVDVSENMLEKAAQKKVYTTLKVFDILGPWQFAVKFDLIYSSDVFVYLGNLDPVIRSATAFLVPGGLIAFSVESLEDDMKNFKLYPSGRYAHSQTYIQTCLDRHGLKQLAFDSTVIRKQSGKPVKGFLVVAQKENITG